MSGVVTKTVTLTLVEGDGPERWTVREEGVVLGVLHHESEGRWVIRQAVSGDYIGVGASMGIALDVLLARPSRHLERGLSR